MIRDDFAIFILTHGRPDKQLTLNALLKSGYTGKYYLVLDDTDSTIQDYIDNFGADHIIVFDKNHYINTTEVGTNAPPYKCIIYAKNAVEEMAKDMKLSAFMLSDDDCTGYRYRYKDGNSLKSQTITKNMDDIVESYVDFMLTADITALSFSGATIYFNSSRVYENEEVQKWRIPFCTVFRNTSKPVEWKSAFSEDIVTGLQLAKVGNICFSLPFVQYNTATVGGGAVGGMQETYKGIADITRASYDVMYEPASAGIQLIRNKYLPIYKKAKAFPKIISEQYRREEK